MREDGARDLVADREDGVERRHRLLEHHGDPGATHPAHGFVVLGEKVLALEEDAAGRDASRRRHQPHDRQRRDALAAPALAHEAQHLAALEREAHPVHRPQDALARREVRLEALDREQRRHH